MFLETQLLEWLRVGLVVFLQAYAALKREFAMLKPLSNWRENQESCNGLESAPFPYSELQLIVDHKTIFWGQTVYCYKGVPLLFPQCHLGSQPSSSEWVLFHRVNRLRGFVASSPLTASCGSLQHETPTASSQAQWRKRPPLLLPPSTQGFVSQQLWMKPSLLTLRTFLLHLEMETWGSSSSCLCKHQPVQ